MLKILQFIKYRWQAKLGSLIIAIIFYYYVQYTKTATKTFFIRVETPTIPNHLVFREEPPPFIKVEFSGPEELLAIDPSNFKLYLINTGPTAGLNNFRLELIPPPPPSLQVNLEYSEIQIQLDNKKRKTFPIQPVFDLPPNKKLYYWNFNPMFITIEGPESTINREFYLKLIPIKLSANSTIFYGRVMFQQMLKFTKLVENQPFEVQLELRYYTEEEFQERLNQLPFGFNSFELEIPVNCRNNLGNLEIASEQKVKIFYISKYFLTANSFVAETFCPVELDNSSESIIPSNYIPDLPVVVKPKLEIQELEILKIEPLTVGLQFRIKKKIPINQLEKGLQEHLIR